MYHRPYTRAGASVTILASIFDHHDNEFLVENFDLISSVCKAISCQKGIFVVVTSI